MQSARLNDALVWEEGKGRLYTFVDKFSLNLWLNSHWIGQLVIWVHITHVFSWMLLSHLCFDCWCSLVMMIFFKPSLNPKRVVNGCLSQSKAITAISCRDWSVSIYQGTLPPIQHVRKGACQNLFLEECFCNNIQHGDFNIVQKNYFRAGGRAWKMIKLGRSWGWLRLGERLIDKHSALSPPGKIAGRGISSLTGGKCLIHIWGFSRSPEEFVVNCNINVGGARLYRWNFDWFKTLGSGHPPGKVSPS